MKLCIEPKIREGIKSVYKSILFIIFIFGIFSGCAQHHDDSYYDRANKASEKALEKLDRE